MLVQQPEYEQGRQRSNQQVSFTKQIVPFSNLDHNKILADLLKLEHSENCGKNLNDYYEAYVNDIESRNIENVDHYK